MQKLTKQKNLKDIKPKYLFTKNIREIIVYHHFGAKTLVKMLPLLIN
jgi:hypothetical protein